MAHPNAELVQRTYDAFDKSDTDAMRSLMADDIVFHVFGTSEFAGDHRGIDGILDLFHVAAQGVVAGANMVLVDFHPNPAKALVDGPQALLLSELSHFLEDIALSRETYLRRAALAIKHRPN